MSILQNNIQILHMISMGLKQVPWTHGDTATTKHSQYSCYTSNTNKHNKAINTKCRLLEIFETKRMLNLQKKI